MIDHISLPSIPRTTYVSSCNRDGSKDVVNIEPCLSVNIDLFYNDNLLESPSSPCMNIRMIKFLKEMLIMIPYIILSMYI